jgi:hypothetical protein
VINKNESGELCRNTTPLSGAKTPRLCLVVTVVPVQIEVDIVVAPPQANLFVVLAIAYVLLYVPVRSITATPVAVFVARAFQVVVLWVDHSAPSARVRLPFLAIE